MPSITTIKHICSRCGNSIEVELPTLSRGLYPPTWQHIVLGQTGAELDLCDTCNKHLLSFLEDEGATGMSEACINKREVL